MSVDNISVACIIRLKWFVFVTRGLFSNELKLSGMEKFIASHCWPAKAGRSINEWPRGTNFANDIKLISLAVETINKTLYIVSVEIGVVHTRLGIASSSGILVFLVGAYLCFCFFVYNFFFNGWQHPLNNSVIHRTRRKGVKKKRI